jgi:hypothetical protein
MTRNLAFTIFGVGLTLLISSITFAQNAPQFKAGEVVEVHSYFFNPPWHQAKVLNVGTDCQNPTPYRVKFIGEDAGDHGNPCVGGDDIRALAKAENPPPADNQNVADNTARPANGGAFNIGDRVDVIYAYAKDKGARGTIIEATAGRYKVHYDGCQSHRDVVVDREVLFPAATISADASEIKFLIGKWAMFTPSYPNTVVSGDGVYREYGMGAKAPPLQINADGTYVWYFDFGKPPVKGKWTTHAKIEGTKYGTEVWNGVIIKDPTGAQWKVYRWRPEGETKDHITAQTMCSGMTVIGKRIQ